MRLPQVTRKRKEINIEKFRNRQLFLQAPDIQFCSFDFIPNIKCVCRENVDCGLNSGEISPVGLTDDSQHCERSFKVPPIILPSQSYAPPLSLPSVLVVTLYCQHSSILLPNFAGDHSQSRVSHLLLLSFLQFTRQL